MIAYTFYEYDSRVRRYAETLAKRGDHVDVIALRQRGQPSRDVIYGVNVFRIQQRVVNETRRASYLFKLLWFFVNSMLVLIKMQLQNRYQLIHVHSVPDCEVFAAWLPKLMGAKIILDIHDLVPEFYASKFSGPDSSMMVNLLIRIERLSCAFADHVIIANDIWKKTLTCRSIEEEKCTALLNFPDTSVFSCRGRKRSDGKFIMLYPGTLNHHQGLDIAIRAFAFIKDDVPQAEFHIYGIGPTRDSIATLIGELGLEHRVFLRPLVPPNELATIMENSDLGVVPKRKGVFSDEAFSTKILEFMAMRVPVTVSDTKIDRYYFNESLVQFFRGNDEKDLADTMLFLIRNSAVRQALARNAGEYITVNNWAVKEAIYIELVDSLTHNNNKDVAGELCTTRNERQSTV